MTRDFELVRQILMLAEVGGNQLQVGYAFGVRNVAQHLEWMMEAKLVNGRVHKTSIGEPEAFEIFEPTWLGLEFLSDARDEETWQKAKAICGESSFGVLSAMLHDAALRRARARM